jgi:3D (Asp-Asp-Asp) domain-containing protein
MKRKTKLVILTYIFCFIFCFIVANMDYRKGYKATEVEKENVESVEKEIIKAEDIGIKEVEKEEVKEEKKDIKNEKTNEESKEVEKEKTTEEDKEESNLISLGEFKLTAYCSCSKCCGKWAGSPTASGVMPRANHTIAVDTSVIPFGTKVMINGNTYVAEDTGSAIKGNKIDVFFDSHSSALNFGVQYAEVFVVR